jgi:glycosyltransferase involved in cell wall biosynthesis
MRYRFRLLSLMDRFLAISKPICESYRRAGLPMAKLEYIPQGVDVQRFAPANRHTKERLKTRLGLSHSKQIVTFVGTILERKGVDLLVNAWVTVQQLHPEALLLLVGQDTFGEHDVNRNQLEAFVRRVKRIIASTKTNVLFTGRVDNVEDYLRCSDVFVLPSRQEGFGNVILEAMACAVPPIVSHMDGVSGETVSNTMNGLIVDGEQRLAKAICQLLIQPELARKMGTAAREEVIRRFSLHDIAAQYVRMYNSILMPSLKVE